MKTRLLLIFAVLLFASVASAQDGLFTLASDQPVVPNGASLQDWDNPYTDPGAVFFYDGKFRMFRNGFQGWPAPVQIGYLTSDDGINWTEASEDPVHDEQRRALRQSRGAGVGCAGARRRDVGALLLHVEHLLRHQFARRDWSRNGQRSARSVDA